MDNFQLDAQQKYFYCVLKNYSNYVMLVLF